MFFFFNYEGLRENLGETEIETVPDSYTLQGLLPSTVTGGVPATCTNVGTVNPAYPTVSYFNCGAGSANASKFAVLQPYLNLYIPSRWQFPDGRGHDLDRRTHWNGTYKQYWVRSLDARTTSWGVTIGPYQALTRSSHAISSMART